MNQDEQNNNSIDPSENADVGAFIVHLRESVGWTQAELARKMECDVANLSKVESNRRGISAKKLVYIYELVRQERKERQQQDAVQQQSLRKCANYIEDVYREILQSGMPEGRARVVRETMDALVKGTYSDDE